MRRNSGDRRMHKAILLAAWCLLSCLALTPTLQVHAGVIPDGEIQIQPSEKGVLFGPAAETRTTEIRFQIHNSDHTPADAVQITVAVTDDHGADEILLQQRMALAGDQTVVIRQPWTPTQPGNWTVQIDVQSDQMHSQYQENVSVTAITLPSTMQSISAYGLISPWFVLSGLLMLMAAAFITVGYTLYIINRDES